MVDNFNKFKKVKTEELESFDEFLALFDQNLITEQG